MCVDDTSCIYSHLVELKSRDVYLKVGDELNLHCDGTGIKTPRMAIKNQFGQTVGGPSKGLYKTFSVRLLNSYKQYPWYKQCLS